MKKILLSMAFLGVFTLASAQVEKGDVSGTTSLTYFNTQGVSIGMFLLKGGYFVSNHVEVGASFNLFFAPDNTGIGIGPYGTYNFLTADAKLMPYAGASLSILSFAGSSINSIGLYGGAKYFLTEAVNVDGGVILAQGFGDADGFVFTATIGIGVVLGKLNR